MSRICAICLRVHHPSTNRSTIGIPQMSRICVGCFGAHHPSIKISVTGKRMLQILKIFSCFQACPRKITAKSPTLGTAALSAWTTPAINQNSPHRLSFLKGRGGTSFFWHKRKMFPHKSRSNNSRPQRLSRCAAYLQASASRQKSAKAHRHH